MSGNFEQPWGWFHFVSYHTFGTCEGIVLLLAVPKA